MSATALKKNPSPVFSCEEILWIHFSLLHFTPASVSTFSTTILSQNFGKCTGKQLCRSFVLIKLQTIKPSTLLKREFSTFYCEFCKNFYRHLFFQNSSHECFWFQFSLLNVLRLFFLSDWIRLFNSIRCQTSRESRIRWDMILF